MKNFICYTATWESKQQPLVFFQELHKTIDYHLISVQLSRLSISQTLIAVSGDMKWYNKPATVISFAYKIPTFILKHSRLLFARVQFCPSATLVRLPSFWRIVPSKCRICSVVSNLPEFTGAKFARWMDCHFCCRFLSNVLTVFSLHVIYVTAWGRMGFLMYDQVWDYGPCIPAGHMWQRWSNAGLWSDPSHQSLLAPQSIDQYVTNACSTCTR